MTTTVTDVPATKMPKLYYGVEDKPPLGTTILFGFQQILVCTSGVLTMPLLVANAICADVLARVQIVSTMIVTVGFSTILQTVAGIRQPLLQGPSASVIPPILSVMSLPEYACTTDTVGNGTINNTLHWTDRMTVIQGGLIMASLFQMLVGATGLIGFLTRFIGPLTVAPLMLLLEISVIDVIMDLMLKHWVSILLVLFLLLFALYLEQVRVPLPTLKWNKLNRKITFQISWSPLFALFPYIFAVIIMWILCLILTESGVFRVGEKDFAARTDIRSQAIREAPWIRFPYPAQWGTPKLTTAMFVGMLAGVIACTVESIGDYSAAARVMQQPVPPAHAMNRGIFMEGFGSFLGGLLGGGPNVTTYSENIGVIGITRVASRRTMIAAGIIFIVIGLFTKISAILTTLPDPLMGSILGFSLAMLGGVGLSSLQLVDLNLSRNMAILGLSIMFGIMVPRIVRKHPFQTGNAEIDQLFYVLLTTEMIVGALIGFVLDNSVPGATKYQRGLRSYEDTLDSSVISEKQSTDIYTFPNYIMRIIAKIPGHNYVPMFPKVHSNSTVALQLSGTEIRSFK